LELLSHHAEASNQGVRQSGIRTTRRHLQPSGSATTQGQRVGGIRVGTFDRNPQRRLDRVSVDCLFTDKAVGERVGEVGVVDRRVPVVDRRLVGRSSAHKARA
jgi:hypothetical protein